MIKIKVIEDFTEYPGGRSRKISDHSGQEFAEDHLIPKFQEAKDQDLMLEIDMEGTAGYPSSFLDEAFGRLSFKFGYCECRDRLIIKHRETKAEKLKGRIDESMKEWADDGIHPNSDSNPNKNKK